MSAVAHLVQDLRAHAHEAPAHLRGMIRRAADELERRDRPSVNMLLNDADVQPPPIGPPELTDPVFPPHRSRDVA